MGKRQLKSSAVGLSIKKDGTFLTKLRGGVARLVRQGRSDDVVPKSAAVAGAGFTKGLTAHF